MITIYIHPKDLEKFKSDEAVELAAPSSTGPIVSVTHDGEARRHLAITSEGSRWYAQLVKNQEGGSHL